MVGRQVQNNRDRGGWRSCVQRWVIPTVCIFSVIVALTLMPVVWAAVMGLPASRVPVSELGSIMGAVFTVGGLVVALISIYSFSTIRREVENGVSQARHEFQGETEQQLLKIVTAYDMYVRARMNVGPQGAETLIREGLSIYPNLKGAAYFLATEYHKGARSSFRKRQLERPNNSWFIADVASPEASAHKAIEWLKEARDRADGPDHHISAMLAESFGILGPSCRDEILKELRPTLLGSGIVLDLVCISNAFATQESDLKHLSKALNKDILWTSQALRERLDRLNKSSRLYDSISTYAFTKPLAWQGNLDDLPISPCTVVIAKHEHGVQAIWTARGHYDNCYLSASRDDDYSFDVRLSVDELVDTLIRRFWFISDDSTPTHYEERFLPDIPSDFSSY